MRDHRGNAAEITVSQFRLRETKPVSSAASVIAITDREFCRVDHASCLPGSSMQRVFAKSTTCGDVRLLTACAVLALSACGGGGGGVEIGDGQDPDPVVLDFPIAYVKRPLLLDDNGALVQGDLRRLNTF